jgi:hypothetical protein
MPEDARMDLLLLKSDEELCSAYNNYYLKQKTEKQIAEILKSRKVDKCSAHGYVRTLPNGKDSTSSSLTINPSKTTTSTNAKAASGTSPDNSTDFHADPGRPKLSLQWESPTYTISSSKFIAGSSIKCGTLEATVVVTASPGPLMQLTFSDVYFFDNVGEIEGRKAENRIGEAIFLSDTKPLSVDVRRFACSTSWSGPVMVAKLDFVDAQGNTYRVKEQTRFTER